MNLNEFLPVITPFKKKEYKYKFTFFIPVYNGEKTIFRALNSIEKQTFKDFEVIVINDGSLDKTEKIVKEFMATSNLKISYYKNDENIHKMGTILRGIKLAEGEFFLVHDADDECLPNALQIYYDAYESIPSKIKPQISGVTANCVDQNGHFLGTNIETESMFCNVFDYHEIYKIRGEKWGPTKTDVLKQFDIDNSIINRGLIPEAYLWLSISKAGYITMYLNSVTRIYHVNNVNNLSGLKYDKKSFGMALYSILFMNYFSKQYLFKKPKPFVKRLISLILASNYLDYTFKTYFKSIDHPLLKFLLTFFWPFRKFGKSFV